MLGPPYKCVVILTCALALALAGCGGKQSGSHQHRHKHVVLVHASLGFGAFQRFIWLPAQAGKLSDSLSPAVKDGSTAATFAYRQLSLAAHQVQRSKRLAALFAPLEVTADKLKALAPALSRPGSLTQIKAIHGTLTRLAATAKHNGARIVYASLAKIAAAGGPRA